MASATKPTANSASVAGATTALVLLTALNFVNYIDRYILPGVQEQIKGEFHISDAQIGSLTLWFMVAYMLTSPITGWLGDRFPRKPMIVIAALFWSGINFFTATVHSYDSLNLRHAALGIGEASFGIFAPAILADFYPEDQRNRVLTIFNVAIPVGAALGYLVGGTVGEHYGWRMSFIVSAIPGVIIALLIAFFMKEPSPRSQPARKGQARKGHRPLAPEEQSLPRLHPRLRCRHLLARRHLLVDALLPCSASTAAAQSSAAFIMGAITVVTGLGGTITGGASRKSGPAPTPRPSISSPPSAPASPFRPRSSASSARTPSPSTASPPPSSSSSSAPAPSMPPPSTRSVPRFAPPPWPASSSSSTLSETPSPRASSEPSATAPTSISASAPRSLPCCSAAVIFFIGSRYAPPLQPTEAVAAA